MKGSIFINQIGYKPFAEKKAFVAVKRFFTERMDNDIFWQILNTQNDVVCSGCLEAPKTDSLAGEDIAVIDFTDFSTPGLYTIKIPDFNEHSYPFMISDDVFNQIFYDTLHFFYLSRCGAEIKSVSDAGMWNHRPCHTQIAEIYGSNGEHKNVTGGWHDAGDYGRYVIATTKAAMDLMFTAEEVRNKSEYYQNLVDEVIFGINWLLQMQREDGAVYHKISSYHFCGFIAAIAETDTQVISPVSTAATADFAGCLAYAYKFLKNVENGDYSELAEKCLEAAIKAQNYLDCHEDEIYTNPKEITTGCYGDKNLKDEHFFALASLYAVTQKEEYLQRALKIRQEAIDAPLTEQNHYHSEWSVGYGWGTVSGYGLEILLKCDLITDRNTYEILKKDIVDRAEKDLEISENSQIGVCVNNLGWGSNGHLCDEAHILLLAYDLTNNLDYYVTAVRQVNYILGCNTMNLCYVTKSGGDWPNHPHHRPSGVLKTPMPGMLAGGPCQGLSDETARKNLAGKPPMQCYIDDQQSYSTNEVDIYWNSPLVYVLGVIL